MTPSSNPEIEQLQQAHASMKLELHSLSRRAHLTPREEERARILKKEKLRTKDRLRMLTGHAVMR